jgi:hypothetical protein
MVEGTIQSNEFWPLQLPFKNLRVHQDSHSQSGNPFGSVWFIPSHFPKLPKAWNVTLGPHSWFAPPQALGLVTSSRLGLQQNNTHKSIPTNANIPCHHFKQPTLKWWKCSKRAPWHVCMLTQQLGHLVQN